MEEMSAFIALQSFLNGLRSPTVRMIFEKVKENGFAEPLDDDVPRFDYDTHASYRFVEKTKTD